MTKTALKYFTLAEANATLPYVQRIVEDLVQEYQRWRACIFRYEVLAAEVTSDEGESEEQVSLRKNVDDIAQRINGFIDELSQVGCVFKGFEGGLVDFRTRLEERDAYLCWKLGESEIRYWHEADAGFADRRPVGTLSFEGDAL